MLETIKSEIRQNWIKIVLILVACAYLYCTIDYVKDYLSPKQPQTISNIIPQYINPYGNMTVNPPTVIVEIPQSEKSTTTVGIKQKADSTSADVVLNDNKTNYTFEYVGLSGKPAKFNLQPTFNESSKFVNGQLVITREVTMNTKVAVPTPDSGIGMGMTLDKKPVIGYMHRIGKSNTMIVPETDFTKKGSRIMIYAVRYN